MRLIEPVRKAPGPPYLPSPTIGCDAYKFLFIAKGGGSANKSFLFQETRAVLNPKALVEFLTQKMVSLGTAACPPYHLVFRHRRDVRGGDA